MKAQTHKGILVKWKDDKGFGFIKSETDTKEVFLHISAIPKQSRRPRIGDTIIYDLKIEDNGKLKANYATIEGFEIRFLSKKKNTITNRKNNFPTKLIGLIGIGIVAIIVQQFSPSSSPPIIQSVTKPECKIKGNISQNSGKKHYHLPGMEDYESTVISPKDGEKWFCTEKEAISQGWVKAPN
jgi:cold shock CspA family protein